MSFKYQNRYTKLIKTQSFPSHHFQTLNNINTRNSLNCENPLHIHATLNLCARCPTWSYKSVPLEHVRKAGGQSRAAAVVTGVRGRNTRVFLCVTFFPDCAGRSGAVRGGEGQGEKGTPRNPIFTLPHLMRPIDDRAPYVTH